jgi:hypothetical protein
VASWEREIMLERKRKGVAKVEGRRCHAAVNGFLLNLRANRWVTLGSNHCNCSLN